MRPLLQIVDLGAYGVDAFFVLSGFLITCLLLLDRGKPNYYRNFYWKRILRIQPVYLLHLVAVWFLLPASHGYVLLALVFLVNFDSVFHIADVGPAWTLSIEEQFYLLWPQVIRRTRVHRIYQIALGLIVGSVGLRLFMSVVFRHMSVRYTIYRFDGLGLGALLALQWMGVKPLWEPVIRVIRWLNASSVLVLVLVYLSWSALFPAKSLYALNLFAVNLSVYRLIRFTLHHPGARSTALLRSGPMVFLGAISYSLYMFHTIIMFLYDQRFGPPSFRAAPFLARTMVVSAVTVILCVASRFLVELPIQRLRRFVVR